MSGAGRRRLTPGLRRGIFLFEQGAFAADPATRTGTRRLTSLAAYLQAMTHKDAEEAMFHGDVLGRAAPLVARSAELEFVLRELLPHLRSLGGKTPTAIEGIDDLSARACELRTLLAARFAEEPYANDLASSVATPRVLVGRASIPLEPVSRCHPSALHVTVEDQHYRYCLEQTESLQEFLRRAAGVLRALMRGAVVRDPELKVRIQDYRRSVQEVLKGLKPKKAERYSVIYRDAVHQLQYREGAWVLVRGPLPMRVGTGTVFVGMQVRGGTRPLRLSQAPAVGTAASVFWTPTGQPTQSGICMGSSEQYERLLSERFTDAEAFVQWLDAAAIIATERPAYHRMWRDGGKLDEAQVPF